MYKLKIITSSTRPGRKGPAVASWIYKQAKQFNEFDVELIDLAEINLPFLDEPNHPRLKQYVHKHTKNWSNKIDEADAFIFVTAEYNHSYPAPIKNAIDYLHSEWLNKPAVIVSYGGFSGGSLAAQMLKNLLEVFKMKIVSETLNIRFFTKYINENGMFNGDENMKMVMNSIIVELLDNIIESKDVELQTD